MDLQLKGKAAVVTGATRGIGRAIAEILAEEGADVAICARKADEVGDAVEALGRNGVKVFGKAADIADGDAFRAFIADAGEALGGIDILVCNASGLASSAAEDQWRKMLDVDLLGAVRGFEAAQPFLERAAKAKGDAAVVMISSISAAETTAPSAYGPMKAAMIHYAKGLARQHAAAKIRVNVVSPGTIYFDDGFWGRVKRNSPDFYAQMIERNPTGRMGTPEEVASAVAFLVSPRSSFTTGANLLVDGSITARVNF